MPKLMNKKAAAQKLHISVSKLDKMRANGEIGCVLIGRCVRFTEEQLVQAVVIKTTAH